METLKKNLRLLMVIGIVAMMGLTACEEEEEKDEIMETEEETIVDIASSDDSYSTLVQALEKADLASTLKGDGPFTVFAPTNEAFESLLDDLGVGSLDDLSADQLEPILLYHVVSGNVMSTDLSNGYVPTLSPGADDTKASLLINTDDGVMLNGSSAVTAADIEADNGVIHEIDKVLMPPNVVDMAINNGDFSTLVDAVVKAELAETLSGEGPFTVFAPTNAAFEELLSDLGASSLDDLTKDDLIPILKYHVVSGNVLSSDLSSGRVTTLNGNDIAVDVSSSVMINGKSSVTAADIQGTNGVIHVIDKVLLPDDAPKNIVETASGDDQFSTLVEALTKADLASVLEGEGPYTVFAPTNDAFSDLLSELGVGSLDDLTAEQLEPILLYHVVSGNVMSTDLSNGYVPTLSPGADDTKASLLINTDDGVMLNGSSAVTAADIEADNGVIHEIDKVLMPPNVVDMAINNGDFSTLVDAVVKAELAETLSGEGPFTVFAPTNAAFEELLSDLGASSLDDLTKDDLIPILKYHVVSGNVLSSDLSSGRVTTLNGNDIAVDVSSSVMINGKSSVTAADIQGTNGVIHVIDKVLLPDDAPKNIVETASGDDQFSTLVEALTKADLASVLEGEGPYTVFAPTNDAFSDLLSELGVGSLDDLTAEQL
ncbi:MAG: fasciclin domain-containing protein, partial [Bacteroidales bacterium]|nr:fasciclin domain-containing protein [Bacteroidales bacterium]MBS3774981.1 fasciclin domain-containing protein [Bacteroidales bacterium]